MVHTYILTSDGVKAAQVESVLTGHTNKHDLACW